MTYESKSFKEHHLTRLPVLERLLLLGWEREQIICPSPNSDDTDWRWTILHAPPCYRGRN